jgi:hypothetical protein
MGLMMLAVQPLFWFLLNMSATVGHCDSEARCPPTRRAFRPAAPFWDLPQAEKQKIY